MISLLPTLHQKRSKDFASRWGFTWALHQRQSLIFENLSLKMGLTPFRSELRGHTFICFTWFLFALNVVINKSKSNKIYNMVSKLFILKTMWVGGNAQFQISSKRLGGLHVVVCNGLHEMETQMLNKSKIWVRIQYKAPKLISWKGLGLLFVV